jgi:uncharacterized membrane protein
MLTATVVSPLPTSLAVPQMSPPGVSHPAAQTVRFSWVAVGKVMAAVGAVASTVHVVEVAALVLPAPSTARTATVWDACERLL